jgi:hypothetical protein
MKLFEVTKIPKGIKLGENLDISGTSLGVVKAKNMKEAANIIGLRTNYKYKNVRVFPVIKRKKGGF